MGFPAEEIEKRFKHHPPSSAEVAGLHEQVRAEFRALADSLNEKLPHCRELSTAMTSLEQGMFWANAAIARNCN